MDLIKQNHEELLASLPEELIEMMYHRNQELKIKKILDEHELLMQNLSYKNELLEQNQEKIENDLRKVSEKVSFFDNEEYLKASDLGRLYNPSISAVRLNGMLATIGLVNKTSGEKAEPSQMAFNENLAIETIKDVESNGYIIQVKHHKWHTTRTMKRIENWLKRINKYDEFLHCKNKKELDKFIDNLILR